MAKITQIIIGDEILCGKIQDLNMIWLAKKLLSTNHKLLETRIIGDNEEQIKQVLSEALKNSDAVIITGGLGPTKDDKTKLVLGQWLGTELEENDLSTEYVTKQYARYNRPWDKTMNSYHMIPKGITPLFNPAGFAPGLMAQKDSKYIFAAPGVPREFQEMFSQIILPVINENLTTNEVPIELYNIRTQGVPEEQIFNKLCPTLWEDLEQYGSVSSLPNVTGVDITIKMPITEKLEENKQKILEIVNQSEIKEYIWAVGDEDLAEMVVKNAIKKNLTISLAESCTGGLVSSMLTDISGSSKVFLGSVVSYANDVKINQLNVRIKTIEDHGAVSEQTAKEMAIGAVEKLRSNIAISLSGIAGPNGATIDKPVGTVCIAIATDKAHIESNTYNFVGDRARLKLRFANKALIELLSIIEKY